MDIAGSVSQGFMAYLMQGPLKLEAAWHCLGLMWSLFVGGRCMAEGSIGLYR